MASEVFKGRKRPHKVEALGLKFEMVPLMCMSLSFLESKVEGSIWLTWLGIPPLLPGWDRWPTPLRRIDQRHNFAGPVCQIEEHRLVTSLLHPTPLPKVELAQ